ncbi:hypothetical protein jhhlp_005805 [Lomentospora prolificans]|uniref:Uncharacterized protein n=1 Tax=Lomentospora prolificans TaxID=41688 RepID=A0A2N3N461_9PEZI|nr:hypothetical protein jhhlp_005805 [Lomentospora prolificans]
MGRVTWDHTVVILYLLASLIRTVLGLAASCTWAYRLRDPSVQQLEIARVCALFALLVLECQPKVSALRVREHGLSPEDTVGVFSATFF